MSEGDFPEIPPWPFDDDDKGDFDEGELQQMTKQRLKELCKLRTLSPQGKKAALVARLLAGKAEHKENEIIPDTEVAEEKAALVANELAGTDEHKVENGLIPATEGAKDEMEIQNLMELAVKKMRDKEP
eukprot:7972383-Karenia_brevis.AAC.1